MSHFQGYALLNLIFIPSYFLKIFRKFNNCTLYFNLFASAEVYASKDVECKANEKLPAPADTGLQWKG